MTQVSSMPPIMMNLSWVARLSISLITVLDSPSMLATSSIFLCVPCAQPKQSHSAVNSHDQEVDWAHTATLRQNVWENSGTV